ncbi:Elongation of very long chain fatty acids protein AAEL008004 [Papilio machaon]|uniref:Elongation of very long chain fatty acids protein n=1 Tax=Papilio machaon TaxID=76193 RepID=A0A194RDH0_PAPMA|nr:Elongation of very long chain fatty acids protein AAEL008004 [Papilio machaon]
MTGFVKIAIDDYYSDNNWTTIINKYWMLAERVSDPRVQGWFLFDTPLPTLAMVIAYLAFVMVAGPLWMANKKPFRIQNVLVAYNAGQVLLSLYMFYEHLASGWWGDYSLACQPVDYSESDKARRTGSYTLGIGRSGAANYFTSTALARKSTQSEPIGCASEKEHASGAGAIFHGAIPFNKRVAIRLWISESSFPSHPFPIRKEWGGEVQFFMVLFHSISALLYDCGYPKLIASGLILHSTIFIVLFTNFYMHAYKKEKVKPLVVNNNNKGEGITEDTNTSEHANGHIKVNGHMCNKVNGHIANGYISNGTLSNGITKASLHESHDDVLLYETNGISNGVNRHIVNYNGTEKEKTQ